jgi:methionyl aminopeptidase
MSQAGIRMEEEILENYRRAGRIAAEARDLALRKTRPGVLLLDIAEEAEAFIKKKGALPAFPVNISLNDVAAHYTPSHGDARAVGRDDLVKIDVGVHVDGYIGDTAATWSSGSHPLIRAVNGILSDAIKILKPGVTVGEIGSVIQGAAESRDVGLIVNLTGHTLDRYVFHGPPSIPNVRNESSHAFREGDVLALEPFTCPSNGHVKESGITEIYRFLQKRPVRLSEARKILDLAENSYKSLPFAKRWLFREISPVKVSLAMRQLEQAMALEPYSVLRESSGMPIAQAEHTIVIRDKPLVTTRTE